MGGYMIASVLYKFCMSASNHSLSCLTIDYTYLQLCKCFLQRGMYVGLLTLFILAQTCIAPLVFMALGTYHTVSWHVYIEGNCFHAQLSAASNR